MPDPLDIDTRLEELEALIAQSPVCDQQALAKVLALRADIQARFIDTTGACIVPCASEPLCSGVVAEDVFGKLCLTIWENGGTEPDGDNDHAGAILDPDCAMLLGRWLCSWAGARLSACVEVACANS